MRQPSNGHWKHYKDMVLDEVIVTLLLEEVRINLLNPLMRPSLFMKNQRRNERGEKMT
jgi:hypothetical protein